MNSDYHALAGRIQHSLLDLERTVERTEFLLSQATKKNDDGYLDGIALNLYSFYGGIERIFGDIARSIDQSIPRGPEWQRNLLLQMAGELTTVRPAVITWETRHRLDEYRDFWHTVENSYIIGLRASRLRELVEELRLCYQAVQGNLKNLIGFLERMAASRV
jgi:hypothetical protein